MTISLFFSVYHAEPSGLPPSLRPGGSEVRRGGILRDLHLPPGLSPGGEGSLLPPSFPPSSSRCPGSLDAVQNSSEELIVLVSRPIHHHHVDTDSRPLHRLQRPGTGGDSRGNVDPAGSPVFRLVIGNSHVSDYHAFLFSEGSKFQGARTKYTSRSQHNQLALANHLKQETAERAKQILRVKN